MCAVDIQYANVFVNRLYRKGIKDKHKIAIEEREKDLSFVTPPPSFIFNATLNNLCNTDTNQINCLSSFRHESSYYTVILVNVEHGHFL